MAVERALLCVGASYYFVCSAMCPFPSAICLGDVVSCVPTDSPHGACLLAFRNGRARGPMTAGRRGRFCVLFITNICASLSKNPAHVSTP